MIILDDLEVWPVFGIDAPAHQVAILDQTDGAISRHAAARDDGLIDQVAQLVDIHAQDVGDLAAGQDPGRFRRRGDAQIAFPAQVNGC